MGKVIAGVFAPPRFTGIELSYHSAGRAEGDRHDLFDVSGVIFARRQLWVCNGRRFQ
jgi:hypothetical protein